jgi:hypothetical protein
MFDDWRRRLGLKRRLTQLNELYLKHLTGSIHFSELDKAGTEFLSERQQIQMELEVLEAKRLIKAASKYGLDGLPTQEIYNSNLKGVRPRPYFRPQPKAQLIKMISEARFNYWKRWTELLVPILSLLIAIIALLKK